MNDILRKGLTSERISEKREREGEKERQIKRDEGRHYYRESKILSTTPPQKRYVFAYNFADGVLFFCERAFCVQRNNFRFFLFETKSTF